MSFSVFIYNVIEIIQLYMPGDKRNYKLIEYEWILMYQFHYINNNNIDLNRLQHYFHIILTASLILSNFVLIAAVIL